ncbi:MAG: PrsW family intramembrane metalloprotease [Chloroflexi bacterium]|nr:PrsW family intramembrane metalloprotease [Chloroflexota bacterium]
MELFPLIAAIILSFIPALIYSWVIYWLDRYEKEPKILLGGVFLWGAIVAAGAAFVVNTVLGVGIYLVSGSEAATEILTSAIVAPLIEESLKGFAVLIVFLIFRREFDSVLDGIVYAGITALGFAATENVLYLYGNAYLEEGWGLLWMLFFLRVIFGAYSHASYTAFTGIGLALARLSNNKLIKIAAPVVGWGIAVFVHSLHNLLAGFVSGLGGLAAIFLIDWFGWLLMAIVILWALSREQKWIKTQLKDEMQNGLLTPDQYHVAGSAWLRSFDRIKALTSGHFRASRRFYHLCTELAYKKHQRSRFGEEKGNTARIRDLRQEISQLAPKVAS